MEELALHFTGGQESRIRVLVGDMRVLFPLSVSLSHEDTSRGQPGRKLSPEPAEVGTHISDPQNWEEVHFCFFQLLGL